MQFQVNIIGYWSMKLGNCFTYFPKVPKYDMPGYCFELFHFRWLHTAGAKYFNGLIFTDKPDIKSVSGISRSKDTKHAEAFAAARIKISKYSGPIDKKKL
jgi:hypothetical protein